MLYRDGIVAWFQGGDGVVTGSICASHEMRVALDIGYGDFASEPPLPTDREQCP